MIMLFDKCLLVTVLAISTAWARTTSGASANDILPEEQVSSPRSSDDASPWFIGDLRQAYKVYKECAASEFSPCLKLKLLAALERISRSFGDIPLSDGVSFVRNTDKADTAPIKTESDIASTLPRSLDEKETTLDSMISEKVVNFFDTHSLQVKFPASSQLQNDESRGKKKKMNGLMLIPLLIGGTLIPLALGGLALLAGKALVISKIALVLAGIIGLKKLFGNQGHNSHHEVGHEVVVGGGHGSSGWGRSYEKEQAQKLAYSAYPPKQR